MTNDEQQAMTPAEIYQAAVNTVLEEEWHAELFAKQHREMSRLLGRLGEIVGLEPGDASGLLDAVRTLRDDNHVYREHFVEMLADARESTSALAVQGDPLATAARVFHDEMYRFMAYTDGLTFVPWECAGEHSRSGALAAAAALKGQGVPSALNCFQAYFQGLRTFEELSSAELYALHSASQACAGFWVAHERYAAARAQQALEGGEA